MGGGRYSPSKTLLQKYLITPLALHHTLCSAMPHLHKKEPLWDELKWALSKKNSFSWLA